MTQDDQSLTVYAVDSRKISSLRQKWNFKHHESQAAHSQTVAGAQQSSPCSAPPPSPPHHSLAPGLGQPSPGIRLRLWRYVSWGFVHQRSIHSNGVSKETSIPPPPLYRSLSGSGVQSLQSRWTFPQESLLEDDVAAHPGMSHLPCPRVQWDLCSYIKTGHGQLGLQSEGQGLAPETRGPIQRMLKQNEPRIPKGLVLKEARVWKVWKIRQRTVSKAQSRSGMMNMGSRRIKIPESG